MKAALQSLSAAPVSEKSWVGVFCDLVKVRLTFLVLLTTLTGFYLGSGRSFDAALMLHALWGTALLACGASALNQFWEREPDGKMRRTQDRPLPSGRMAPETVLLFGVGCSIAGLWHLAVTVNRLTCLIGAVTLLSYVLVYTPLKRRTWLNTLVGAVPGGLPPLMGWTAARGEAGAGGWGLFAILFFWQLAHFLAIAWIYRDEYERAGFVMLPSVDPDGSRTARQAVGHTAALLAVSLGPVALGLAGGVYAAGAVVLGLFFLAAAAAFARRLDAGRARRLFLASVLYLPLLLGLMVFDKLAP